MHNTTRFRLMPVKVDPKAVLVRLGAAKAEKETYDKLYARAVRALSSLKPSGICATAEVFVYGDAVLIGGRRIESVKFAGYMAGCDQALVMASTLGPEISERISALVNGANADEAVMLDAAASEAADAGLDFMTAAKAVTMRMRSLMPLKRRFSPGYGDMPLSAQKTLFDIVGAQGIGLSLTDSYMLVPEKSVIAVCGVKKCI